MRLEDINLRNPITVAYYDPFSVFPDVQDEFLSKLPLSNLHWKYNPLKPGKSIPLLPVELQEEIPTLQQKKSNDHNSLTEKVYLRLMFVKAENLEMYRSQVRPLINAWLESLIKGREVKWAIILIVSGSKREKKSTLIKTSMYDKLKIDFGVSGKQLDALGITSSEDEEYEGAEIENIFKFKDSYDDEFSKLQAYNEVFGHIKRLILLTFDSRYTTYNEKIGLLLKLAQSNAEIQVSEFLYKLRLVHLMGDMRFLKEAIEIFDELSEDLKGLVSNLDHAFDKKNYSFPANLDVNHFSPETSFDLNEQLVQFANYTTNNIPVNLFAVKLGLFLSASLLLQSLANFASSISISSTHILTLLRKLNFFINDISRSYPNTAQLNEWFCVMIDFYLKLPIASKLKELNEENLENGGGNHIEAILECMAELRLLRRTIVGKLAVLKGLELPQIGFVLEDIPLDAEKDKPPSAELTYAPLVAELENQGTYDAYFESSTIAAIEEFVNCNRNVTVDLLSVDLAILHYKEKRYQEALDILMISYDYFILNGWNFMGGALLEIYLECIQKLDTVDHEHILKTNLKLFGALKENVNFNRGINHYSLLKNRRQRRALFDQICEESRHLGHVIEYPLSNLFNVTLNHFIFPEEGSTDEYAILVDVVNPFGVEIEFQQLRITLKNTEQENLEITFSAFAVSVFEKPAQSLILKTKNFWKGNFEVKSIVFQVTENLVFANRQQSRVETVDNTVIHEELNRAEKTEQNLKDVEPKDTVPIAMYPVPGKFRVEVVSPEKIELGVAQFDLLIHNGQQDAKNIKVAISSSTLGVKFDDVVSHFHIEGITKESIFRKSVTFNYFGDTKILDLSFTVVYDANGEVYEYHTTEAHDMSLTLSISVQDLFRMNAIYSKFQIGSVSSKFPVRVLECTFESSDDKYDIVRLSKTISEEDPLLILGEQLAYLFYRLQPKNSRISPSDVLDLNIKYSNLHRECAKVVNHQFLQKLEELKLSRYYYLMLSSMNSLRFNLIHYAVHEEIEIVNVDESNLLMNYAINRFVPSHDVEILTDILVNLFKDKFTKVEDASKNFEHQYLHIPVSVPFLGVLHQVEFLFDRKQRYRVGEPIEATLEIKSTSKWSNNDTREILASSSPARGDPKLPVSSSAFQFTVLNEDQWLLTGLRKHQFNLEGEHSVSKVDVCLVPLNVGELQLPKLNIQPMGGSNDQSIEVVNENALETILIVPELDSLTFSF